jgi:hypothetical protein
LDDVGVEEGIGTGAELIEGGAGVGTGETMEGGTENGAGVGTGDFSAPGGEILGGFGPRIPVEDLVPGGGRTVFLAPLGGGGGIGIDAICS